VWIYTDFFSVDLKRIISEEIVPCHKENEDDKKYGEEISSQPAMLPTSYWHRVIVVVDVALRLRSVVALKTLIRRTFTQANSARTRHGWQEIISCQLKIKL
jgi:hypothetical protein